MNQPVARHSSDEATYLVQAPTTAPAPGAATNVNRPDGVAHLPQGQLAAAEIADDLTLRGPLGGEIAEPDTPPLGNGTSATFEDVSLTQRSVADFRSGT